VSKILAWATEAGERVNPIAVKEFRQAVQNRLVVAVLMLFLLVNLCVVGGYLLLNEEAATSVDGGRGVFVGLYSCLMFVCVGFVPLYTGVRLSLERLDATADLMYVTTITPCAIIRGKFLTAMALTALIFSACMPFLVLTYLLRGIDLPTIAFILLIGFLVCTGANAAGVFAGGTSGSWFMRGLLALFSLFFLLYITGAFISWTAQFLIFGIHMPLGGWEFWVWLGSILLIEALGVGLLHVWSVAMISPKQSNRMFIPRLYITACWLILGALAAAWEVYSGTSHDELVMVWTVLSCVAFCILLAVCIGEQDGWGVRSRRTIPRNPLLRLPAFLFFTGAAGGMLWCILMFVLTLAAPAVCSVVFQSSTAEAILADHDYQEMLSNMPVIFGFVLCYCLTAAALRWWLLPWIPAKNLPLVAAMIGMLACLLPVLGAFLLHRGWWDYSEWYTVASPIVLGSSNEAAIDLSRRLLGAWLLLSAIAAAPWAFSQWGRFVPHRAAAVSPLPLEEGPGVRA